MRRLTTCFVGCLFASSPLFAQSNQQELQDVLLGLLPPLAETTPQRAVARAIAVVCPNLVFNAPTAGSAAEQLLEDCSAVVGSALDGDGNAPNALTQIAPDHTAAAADAAQTALDFGSAAIRGRVAAIRADARATALAAVGENTLVLMAASAASQTDSDHSGWGVFATTSFKTGDKDGTANEEGFDFDEFGVFVGADFRFRSNWVAGAGLSYSQRDTDLDFNGGTVDVDDTSLVGYFSYAGDTPWEFQADLTFGQLNNEAERGVSYGLPAGNALIPEGAAVNQRYRSDFDGDKWGVAAALAYRFIDGGMQWAPRLQLNHLRLELDDFSETASSPLQDGAGWAIAVEDQTFRSTTAGLGLQWSYAMSQSWGVLLPFVQVDWRHEFEDDERTIVARFVDDPINTPFFIPTDETDQNYLTARLGLSAQFRDGWSGFIGYDGVFAFEDVSHHAIALGIRAEF